MVKRDYATQAFVTKIEQEEYLIEEAKHTIITELHALEGRMGAEATRKWLSENFVSLPF